MQYMIIVHGQRLAGYGPFATKDAARTHADKYFQDFRNEVIEYTKMTEKSGVCDRCDRPQGFAEWREDHSCFLCESCFGAMEADMGGDNADH